MVESIKKLDDLKGQLIKYSELERSPDTQNYLETSKKIKKSYPKGISIEALESLEEQAGLSYKIGQNDFSKMQQIWTNMTDYLKDSKKFDSSLKSFYEPKDLVSITLSIDKCELAKQIRTETKTLQNFFENGSVVEQDSMKQLIINKYTSGDENEILLRYAINNVKNPTKLAQVVQKIINEDTNNYTKQNEFLYNENIKTKNGKKIIHKKGDYNADKIIKYIDKNIFEGKYDSQKASEFLIGYSQYIKKK